MTRSFPVLLTLGIGCAGERLPTTERDVDAVSQVLEGIDVHRAVALAMDPEGTLDMGNACRVDDVHLPQHLPMGSILWQGPCLLDDGARLDGSITLFPTEDGTVLSAEGLEITSADELQVALSGAIEVSRVDDLLQLQVSIQACGVLGPSCSAQDPTIGLDLGYSIHPFSEFPNQYMVSVSGAVEGKDAFISVEGAWQADSLQCGTEPAEGSVALGTSPRQTLTVAPTDECDGCVAWLVEGIEVEPLCTDATW